MAYCWPAGEAESRREGACQREQARGTAAGREFLLIVFPYQVKESCMLILLSNDFF